MVKHIKRRPYDAFGDYHPLNTNPKSPIIVLLHRQLGRQMHKFNRNPALDDFFTHCYQCFVIVLLPSDQTIQRSTSPYNKLI